MAGPALARRPQRRERGVVQLAQREMVERIERIVRHRRFREAVGDESNVNAIRDILMQVADPNTAYSGIPDPGGQMREYLENIGSVFERLNRGRNAVPLEVAYVENASKWRALRTRLMRQYPEANIPRTLSRQLIPGLVFIDVRKPPSRELSLNP